MKENESLHLRGGERKEEDGPSTTRGRREGVVKWGKGKKRRGEKKN